MGQRQEKISHLIQEVVSELIMRRLKDPRIGFVSIVNVETTRDLSLAKIFVSVFGDDEAKKKSMEGLNSAKGLIRGEVARVLGTRHAPDIQFVLDEGIEHSIKVSRLLSEIKSEEKEKEAGMDKSNATEKEQNTNGR